MIMRRKIPLLLLFALIATVAMLVPTESGAAGPNRISYQGSVTDSAGTAIPDDTYKMRFTIFDAPSAGSQLWQETQNAVQVTGGLLSVELGSVTPLPVDLFSNANLYLEVEVDVDDNTTIESDEKYSPRQHLTSAAFARNADELDSLDSASFLRSDADDVCTGVIKFTGDPTGFAPTQCAVQIAPVGVDPGDSIFSIYTSGSDMVIVDEPANMTVSGVIQAGTLLFPQSYNRIGGGTPQGFYMTSSSDLLVTDDLEVGDDLDVFGDLSWADKTRYFTINCSDPQPYDDAYGYFRGNIGLGKDSGDTGAQYWYAEVNLPDDAVVTEFKFWYKDNRVAENLTCTLDRRQLGATSMQGMASLASSGSSGEGDDTDATINNATVSNASYAYYVAITFPAGDTYTGLEFRAARIEYTTTGP